MRVIIAGSRHIDSYAALVATIEASAFNITEVVSGTADGVDTLGERWAAENGIPVTRFPADWKRFGKKAGPQRNADMAIYADALILLWDGKSRGSANMLRLARSRKLKICAAVVKQAA